MGGRAPGCLLPACTKLNDRMTKNRTVMNGKTLCLTSHLPRVACVEYNPFMTTKRREQALPSYHRETDSELSLNH